MNSLRVFEEVTKCDSEHIQSSLDISSCTSFTYFSLMWFEVTGFISKNSLYNGEITFTTLLITWILIKNFSTPAGFEIPFQSFCFVRKSLNCKYLKKSVLGRENSFFGYPNDFRVPPSHTWCIYLSPHSDYFLNPVSCCAYRKFLIVPMFVRAETDFGSPNEDCILLRIF